MPSGFQQDQNQLTPSYYRVVIQCGTGNATWYAVNDEADADQTGRISPYTWDNFTGANRPTTQAYADALARGNLRFQYIVEALSNLADCQILDIEVDNSLNGNSQANNDEIAFTVKFDRDEGFLPALMAIKKAEEWGIDGTITYDNVQYPQYYAYVDNGDTVNNTEDAIRDVIWLALSQYDPGNSSPDRTRSTRVFHPVEGSDPLTGEGYQDEITTATPWNNDSDAWSDISVNEIDGTTTTVTTND
jgi:hypothetical protein